MDQGIRSCSRCGVTLTPEAILHRHGGRVFCDGCWDNLLDKAIEGNEGHPPPAKCLTEPKTPLPLRRRKLLKELFLGLVIIVGTSLVINYLVHEEERINRSAADYGVQLANEYNIGSGGQLTKANRKNITLETYSKI